MKHHFTKMMNWSQNMRTKYPYLSAIIGVLLVIVGLLALVTPLTPGSWLAVVGLELLGLRFILGKKFDDWVSKEFPKKDDK